MRTRNQIGLLSLAGSVFLGCAVLALANTGTSFESSYVGEEQREIKSLSRDDISQLETGGGWGLAKAAELNGMPGPKHVLEMKSEIALASNQEEKVRAAYEKMKSDAIPLGTRLVALERQLDESFATGSITEDRLAEQLAAIAAVYERLRYVHLVAHITTTDILSAGQRKNYNRLRGYSTNDPCANVPRGHDAAMWRKHHACE